MARHLLVYGTLRKHSTRNHNYGRLGPQTYVKDWIITGLDMHDIITGGYPAVCVGTGTVVAELHKVSDATFKRIDRMEKAAGYRAQTIDVSDDSVTFYTMDPEQLSAYPKVPSGDWA